MLKLIVPVLLVISFGVGAPAQAPAPDMTENMPNGRFWSKLSYEQKECYLIGYKNGIMTAAVFANGAEPEDKLLASAILGLQPTRKLSLVEIVQGIDHFYQDTPENAPVVVGAAIGYVGLKAGGAKQSELDDFAASVRKKSAIPEKKP